MPVIVRALPTGEPDPAAATTDVVVADAPHAYPCRRCLRDAEVGDRLLLLPYDPFATASPYTGDGPIFVHAEPCAPHRATTEIPEQLRRRLLAVRAYDARSMLRGADVVDGQELEGALDALLADPDAAFVHVHYARPGCFACRVERGAA